MKIVSSVLILRALLFCANRNNYDPIVNSLMRWSMKTDSGRKWMVQKGKVDGPGVNGRSFDFKWAIF